MTKNITKKVFLLISLFFLLSSVWAQDDPFAFDEEGLFEDAEIITDISEIEDDNTASVLNEESVSFTGDISSVFEYGLSDDFINGGGSWADNPYRVLTSSNLMLDIRLKEGIKAFANLSLGYLPSGVPEVSEIMINNSDDTPSGVDSGGSFIYAIAGDTAITGMNYLILDLKEFFIDVNIGYKVYFRFGKQVLNWGQGYLWNPSDLINIQKKSFSDMDLLRSGSSGLKIHVPVGSSFNFYSYLNVTGIDNMTDIALAGKVEALLGNTEVSMSTWWKSDFSPVFGLDLSSRLFGLDLWCEASFTNGDDIDRINSDGSPDTSLDETWVPRASLGASRSFDFGDVNDRIKVVSEFYYNHGGYDEDMFEVLSDANLLNFLTNYYEGNNYGQYYLFFSTSIGEMFGNKDLSYSFSVMSNLSDLSFILSNGFTYSSVDNFSLGVSLGTPIGEDLREYTFGYNATTKSVERATPIQTKVTMSLNF